MSMPKNIQVAVVAATEAGLALAKGSAALSKQGIAPRYCLVTLAPANGREIISFSQLRPDTIALQSSVRLGKNLHLYPGCFCEP